MARTSLVDLLSATRDALLEAEAAIRRRHADGKRSGETARLAEFSLAFEYRVSFRRRRRSRGNDMVLVFGKPRFAWFDRRPVHRMRIVWLAVSGWAPVVEIDGHIAT